MKRMRVAILLLAAFVPSMASADAPPKGPGGPASPLTWLASNSTEVKGDFSPPAESIGIPQSPVSVAVGELRDSRPYGDEGRKNCWLVRYEQVAVEAPDSSYSASIGLSVAFDVLQGDLYCAFTDPAPIWLHSGVVEDKQRKAQEGRWSSGPVRDTVLQSTIPQVLRALWREYGIDPSKTGQIILRPRFVVNRVPSKVVDGQVVPMYEPANVWIIEVLGTPIIEREYGWLTSMVAQFRDRDLVRLPTLITH